MKHKTSLLYRWITALFLLALPAVVHAQFTFTTNNGSITITGYTGSGGALVIPNTTNGYVVTDIGGFAFAYSTNLTSITIPGSVTNVGGLAFTYCKNLTSAYFEGNAPPDDGTNFYGDPHAVVYFMPGTTGWGPTFGGAPTEETTPASDFEYNVYDGSITILSYNGVSGAVVIPAEINGDPVTSIGGGATALAPNVSSVIIPDTVTNIAASAFQGCIGLTTVTVPGSVLSIGDNAFVECNSLTNVTINDGVISIGASAFASCIGLTNVSIPNSVTNIGGFAFNLSGLASVIIPGGVTSIGAYAFDDCRSLTSVTISNDVTSIAESAFANCSSLTSITIPGTVTNIGDDAFADCTNLTSAYFEGNAPPDDGTVFSGDPNTIVYYLPGTTGWGPTFGGAPTEEEMAVSDFEYQVSNGSLLITGYTGSSGAVVIPAEINGYVVTGIGGFAFAYSTSLTSVTIPGSVTNVGGWAFAYCTNLTSAYFEGNAPPDDGTNFYGDPHAIVYYMPGTTGWGPTFGGAPTEETTPASDFEYDTFDGSITIVSYNDIHGNAVVIPAEINGDPVTSLGWGTQLSPGLTSVIIPNTVTNIAPSAFQIPLGLTNVTIPGSVLSIGEGAFSDCQSLTNLIIEDGVISIGDSAFAICGSLTSVTIPNSVTNIGLNAFAACGSLARVTILGGSSIGEMAFDGCSKLTSVILSSNVTSIGESAFANCSSLASITIPAGVTNIGDDAFSPCASLTSVYFEGNAPPDDGTIFSGDTNAIVYYLPGTTGWGPTFGGAPTEEVTTPASDFEYEVYDGSVTITGYYGPGGAVTIPPYINGYAVTVIQSERLGVFPPGVTSVTIPTTVTNIGQSAFAECGITNIVIPNSVTSIGYEAFEGCRNLNSVNIPGSVTSIGDYAFEYSSDLTYVTIASGVTGIGFGAFFDCTGLTSISIPGSVTNIGEWAFKYCFRLANVNIPNGVTTIGSAAFFECYSLTSVTVPNSVTNLAEDAFVGCTGLTNISVDSANTCYSSLNGVLFDTAQDTLIHYPAGAATGAYIIPNSVTNIGEGAFAYSTNLTSITIPGSATNIGAYAFIYCTNLISAYFEGNAPSDNGTAFSSDPTTVYYLPGTTGWGPTFGGAPTELWNPQATAFTRAAFDTAGGQFSFNITGPTNATVVVYACTNLANPVWQPVSTNTLSGGTSSFSDPQSANFPNRYYRFSAP